jgi:hypothetical protein
MVERTILGYFVLFGYLLVQVLFLRDQPPCSAEEAHQKPEASVHTKNRTCSVVDFASVPVGPPCSHRKKERLAANTGGVEFAREKTDLIFTIHNFVKPKCQDRQKRLFAKALSSGQNLPNRCLKLTVFLPLRMHFPLENSF